MARTRYVKRARKSKKTRVCATCGHVVQPGEPYKWMEKRVGYPYYGSQFLYWCQNHSPTPAQTVSSPFRRAIIEIENMVDQLDSDFEASDVESLREEIADAIEDLAYEEREKAENIERGFGHPTELSYEFEGRAYDLEAVAESVRSLDFTEPPHLSLQEIDHQEDEELYEEMGQAWDGWRDEVREALSEAVSEVNI